MELRTDVEPHHIRARSQRSQPCRCDLAIGPAIWGPHERGGRLHDEFGEVPGQLEVDEDRVHPRVQRPERNQGTDHPAFSIHWQVPKSHY